MCILSLYYLYVAFCSVRKIIEPAETDACLLLELSLWLVVKVILLSLAVHAFYCIVHRIVQLCLFLYKL